MVLILIERSDAFILKLEILYSRGKLRFEDPCTYIAEYLAVSTNRPGEIMDSHEEAIKHYVKRKDLSGLIRYFGLEKYEDSILKSSLPSQRLKATKAEDSRWHSHLGGDPYLPNDFEWPHTIDKRPLSFLGQIHMPQIGFWAERYLLPPEGILAFFYDAQKQPWGMQDDDKSSWRVLHFEEDKDLELINPPLALSDDLVFKKQSITLEEEITFPDFQDHLAGDKEFTEPDSYIDFCEEWYQNGSRHRLLGYPQLIQNDIRIECQVVKDRIYSPEVEAMPDYRQRKKSVYNNADNWILLLQIDSDEDTEMFWGDRGTIYFMIEKDNLLNRNFDECWISLQCY